MNRIGLTGLGLLIAMAFSTSSVVADESSLLNSSMLGQLTGTPVTGWAEAGWGHDFGGSQSTGRQLGGNSNNNFGVNQIGLDLNSSAGGDKSVGHRVTFVYGDESLALGGSDDFAFTNANVQWVLPAGIPGLSGGKLTLGIFESPLGGESIYANGNDHVTRGHVSQNTDPISHTGVMVERAIVSGADGAVASGRLGLVNSAQGGTLEDGSDDPDAPGFEGNNPSWLIGVDYAGLAGIDLSVNVLHDAGQDDDTTFDVGVSMDVPGALADVVSLLGDTTIAGHLVWGEDNEFGFSTGARYDFGLPLLGDDGSTKNWYLAVRYGNYDAGSENTGNAWGVTSTLGYQASDNLLMRIEYRWDRDSDGGLGKDSTVPADGIGDEDNQSSLNLNLVVSF